MQSKDEEETEASKCDVCAFLSICSVRRVPFALREGMIVRTRIYRSAKTARKSYLVADGSTSLYEVLDACWLETMHITTARCFDQLLPCRLLGNRISINPKGVPTSPQAQGTSLATDATLLQGQEFCGRLPSSCMRSAQTLDLYMQRRDCRLCGCRKTHHGYGQACRALHLRRRVIRSHRQK